MLRFTTRPLSKISTTSALKKSNCIVLQEMAFKDIFNSLPATPRFDNFTVEFECS